MSDWNPDAVRLQIARDLREIERLYAGLRSEAINRAGDPTMPGGAAMVMLGPGADVEAFGYMQLSAIFGRIDEQAVEEVLRSDIETPLSFLASWTDIVREERGQSLSSVRATVEGECKYLAGAADWMLSTDADGAPEFLPVEDFASGLSKVRYALETVLRAGDRPTKINAECKRCFKAPRLCVRYGAAADGSQDGWYCAECGKDYDIDGVRACWRQMLVKRGDAPEWVTVSAAAAATGRSRKTIYRWTEARVNGTSKIEKRNDPEGDGIEVRWSDVRAAHDTSQRRPWQNAS